ncbi:MAG: threonine synthase, partial [Mariprofundaceae bacterium]|nr:threonine synthase [Mariprofundaceae bacterium]
PALADVSNHLARMRRQWFVATNQNPLGWYAALVGADPASLLAARCNDLPANAQQLWVASPFHAMLGRDTVCLLPEIDFPWSEADSAWLCDELNPLLEGDRMSLHVCGSAMLMASRVRLDAAPAPFASVAGGLLPDRYPEGVDGGRLMRLLAEIQMTLHQQQQPTRSGKPLVHGLWLWGACDLPSELPVGLPPVATLNPALQSLEHGHGAGLMMTEAEYLSALLSSNPSAKKLPQSVLLAGCGHAVLLRKALMPRFGKDWQAGFPASEADLLQRLRRLADAL